ncbi:cellulose biosynthesis protein BcsN [Mesorhizobium sp. ES1-1]|uniref:cellulose biosynthesis protein BcsN n=1 Tax=Mesorhizobium sp. ES1-1 TaxID=2876629 RepID=UPI001CCFFDA6|nr:cellulose biosynthesis protein BcsN [Mesorhizobium sp. ES1-1]MBZ9674320.1 cellulose biosynthesis protein BcsN [Mesorhizobium sp. ES1-1]
MVPNDTAFAFLAPGGPAISAVLERRFSNATQQDILLSTSAHTPGQNMLRVQIFGPVDTTEAGQDRLREGYLPIGNVGSEMRQVLPGIRMQTSPYYVQNKYGPFGYAVGRSASGDTCLYGWQRISSMGTTQTWVGNRGSVQVRLRICDQNASEQKLLEVMYGYTISTYFKSRNWNPYGVPASPDPSLGRSGQPIYPVGVSRFETVTSPPPPRQPVPRASRARSEIAIEPQQAAVLAAPVGPTVPPPPGSGPSTQSPRAAATIRPPTSPAAAAQAADPGLGIVVPPPPCAPTAASDGCKP